MWSAILQPEDNESDLERFADAPDADEDAPQAPAPIDEEIAPPSTHAGSQSSSQAQTEPHAGRLHDDRTGAGAKEEQWPAEGAYDMTKR